MNNTRIEAKLPAELAAQARAFVAEGWATDFNDLLVEALRRFLESHETLPKAGGRAGVDGDGLSAGKPGANKGTS
ncbi:MULTISPECIES: hypothetical protein [Chromatiaceae]|uniref:hypothetical protein n=1 Tax=Chromatiaceae TaxID=1046 RepID=UPI0019067639|nr:MULTISPECIES: hypothetical protein [Chromatiaceae]MCF7977471.1 hypothetical protein [Chromatiaceae bacterium]MCF7995377.1 hypothetical protein [Chromatiaceae bacterium]MCF8015308.1 hypothetical protein [Chromatiaceae bacterium]